MATLLSENQLGIDPVQIGFPSLSDCMGIVVKINDGLFGWHSPNRVQAERITNEVALFKQFILDNITKMPSGEDKKIPEDVPMNEISLYFVSRRPDPEAIIKAVVNGLGYINMNMAVKYYNASVQFPVGGIYGEFKIAGPSISLRISSNDEVEYERMSETLHKTPSPGRAYLHPKGNNPILMQGIGGLSKHNNFSDVKAQSSNYWLAHQEQVRQRNYLIHENVFQTLYID